MPAEMSEIAVIIDNDKFAPSFFLSLCEIGDLDASVFFGGSWDPSEKYLCSNQSPQIHTMTSKKIVHSYYCYNFKFSRFTKRAPPCGSDYQVCECRH